MKTNIILTLLFLSVFSAIYGIDDTLKVESYSRSIYISTAGNDTTGTGTSEYPFASLLKSLQTIKPIIIKDVTIDVIFQDGLYEFLFVPCFTEFKKFMIEQGAKIVISGNMNFFDSISIEIGANQFTYNILGGNYSTNELQQKFLGISGSYIPIASNNSSSLNTIVGQNSATTLNSLGANLICSDLNFRGVDPIYAVNNASIHFVNLNFTRLSGITNFNIKNKFEFANCVFNVSNINIGDSPGFSAINNCAIFFTSLTNAGITYNSNNLKLLNCVIVKSGARGGTGISFSNTPEYILTPKSLGSTYIGNVTNGLSLKNGIYNFNSGDIVLNATNSIVLGSNATVCFTSKMHIDNANTFISNSSALYSYKVFISNPISGVPTNYFSPSIKTNGLCNISKDIHIEIPGIPTSGIANMVNGIATVNTAAVQSGSVIQPACLLVSGIQGLLSISTIVPGVSFTINSSSAYDNSTVSWQIIK